MSAPLFPTSYEECDDLAREFDEEFRTLHAQHEACLADAPDDEIRLGGTCSKSTCQALHTAKDRVGEKRSEEVGICRARVGKHLAEQRRRDERDRRAAEEAEQDRRDRHRRDQERRDQARQQERDRQAEREEIERKRQAEKDRDEHARRDAQDRANRARYQAEALRQAHIRAVAQTAGRLKANWQERLRSGLPDVASDLSSFMQVVRSVARGDGSHSVSDLLTAADALAERAQTAYALVTSPFQTFSDQITADAIDMVRADSAYQRNDPRVQTIFRGIQQVNEIVHDKNPFTKTISSAAFEQIETHFKNILGELEHLETDIGSFDYSRRTHADQPLVNPFRGSSPPVATSSPGSANPWRQGSVPAPEERESSDTHGSAAEIEAHPPGESSTGNPFRSSSATPQEVIPSFPSDDSGNPFRVTESRKGKDHTTAPAFRQSPGMTSSPNTSLPNPLVLYRDPLTRQLTQRVRSSLPSIVTGDALDGSRCSEDGLGVVTETCERQRQGDDGREVPAATQNSRSAP